MRSQVEIPDRSDIVSEKVTNKIVDTLVVHALNDAGSLFRVSTLGVT